MVDQLLAALASTQYGSFSRAQALELGASPSLVERRLDSGRWVLAARGVYSLPGTGVSWHRSLMVACLEAGPDAVASHESAAALHGLATFQPGTAVVVTVTHGDHQHLRTGRLRQSTDLATHHRSSIGGIPVTTVARTVVDLAAVVRPGRLRVVVENALASGACTLDGLCRCHQELRRPGKRGMSQLALVLSALGSVSLPAPTVLERRLLRVLREGGLPDPVREHELPWRRDTPGRVDAAYPADKVLVEADSRRWHSRERDFEVDRRRDREAQLAGWSVYRFTWEDIRERPEEIVTTIRRALATSSK